MSKYSQEEQSNIIGLAAELEAAIITENEELSSLKAEKLQLPEAPKMKEVKEPQYTKTVIPKNKEELFSKWAIEKGGTFKFLFKNNYQPIKLVISISLPVAIVLIFLSIFVGALGIGYLVAISIFLCVCAWGVFIWALILNELYRDKYFASVDWKAAVAQETDLVNKKIYDEYMVRYQEAANEYYAAMEKYNNEVMPDKKMAIWQKSHDAKIAFVENDLKENLDALNILYSSTQLIPSSYRTVERLTWLYEDMSTSEHDIERSIDLLNSKEIKEELINIQGHIDDMRRDLRDGFVGVYEAIQDGNEIQSEMLSNLDGIRRSARIGNFMNVGNLLQNHSRNKTFSQINSKM